ncbi:hypothetical protein H2203_009303 [Taxawa tesnikishii (nom. ined.)]|nr:hypothetical protein H2203_009303 [Dothideales sp. JES 119]
MPSLDLLSEEALLQELGCPRTSPVIRSHGRALEPGMPAYLVCSTSFPVDKLCLQNLTKLIDFGELFLPSNKPHTLHTPLALRAPEVLFEDEWDHRVDLWSMGCMMFELVVENPCDSFVMDKERVVRQMIGSIGRLSGIWQRKWAVMHQEELVRGKKYSLQQWLEETYSDDDKAINFRQENIAKLGSYS